MFYQLYKVSEERMKKYPFNKRFILVFSLSEKILINSVKRIKKTDPGVIEMSQVSEIRPKVAIEDCMLVSGTQEDLEQFYKD